MDHIEKGVWSSNSDAVVDAEDVINTDAIVTKMVMDEKGYDKKRRG